MKFVATIAFATFVAFAAAQTYVWTVASNGVTPTSSTFIDRSLVYFTAGLQSSCAGGLPDGTYVYQVTDPTGQTLLSTDDWSCRVGTVSGGYWRGAGGSCPHSNVAISSCTSQQATALSPFDATTASNGQYKLWLTSLDNFDEAQYTEYYLAPSRTITSSQRQSGSFGFSDSTSKTSAFFVNYADIPPTTSNPWSISFLGTTNVNGDTRFCWSVYGITQNDLSHITFGWTCPSGSSLSVVSYSPSGTTSIGTDAATGIYGFKFDFGQSSRTTKTYCITFAGVVGTAVVRSVIKAGSTGYYVETIGPSCVTPSSTPSNSQTRTPTSSSTNTLTATPSGTGTPSRSQSNTPSPSSTSSATKTPPVTPSQTQTGTPSSSSTQTPSSTGTPSNSPTSSSTNTPTPSNTATQTPTSTSTETPTNSPTRTPSTTSTRSESPTNTATRSVSRSNSPTGSVTASPTVSDTASITPTPSTTRSGSASDSATPTASETPSETPTQTGSDTPSQTGSSTATTSASISQSQTPSRSGTDTSTPSNSPTRTPSITPSSTSSPSRSSTPTPSPTTSPSESGTSTGTGTLSRSFSQTQTPTQTPTGSDTPTPTPSSTATVTDTPTSSSTSSASLSNSETPTTTMEPTGSSTPTLPPVEPSPTPSPTPFPSQSAPPCIGGGVVTECKATSECTRCGTFELKSRTRRSTGAYDLTYEVCNRCENSASFVAFGLEPPVQLISPLAGADVATTSGERWDIIISEGNTGQQPPFRAITFMSKRPTNTLRSDACDTFTFTVSNWSPDWQQTMLLNAGAVYDLFVNIHVGQCLYDQECPAGFAGDDCNQCEDSADWKWWCVPDGGEYTLLRIVPATATPPAGFPANSIDDNGYHLACDCEKTRLTCCEFCRGGVCDDSTGECACPNDVQPDVEGCCPTCTDASCCYNDGNYCNGNGMCVDGACQCVERVDGTTYDGEFCENAISPLKCSDFDCNDCAFADWAVEGGCAWCAGAAGGAGCVTAGSCPSPLATCAGGVGAFTPGVCPNNCSGHGYCNTTTGLCVCDRGVTGLNCGSKNGIRAAQAAIIAGGALAGVIVGAVCLGLIVFACVSYGGYKGIDWLARDAFASNQMHDSPLYEPSGNNRQSALYEAPPL